MSVPNNPYHVGVGQFVVTAGYVVILAFLWRGLSVKLAGSDNDVSRNIGAAMGSTL